MNLSPGEAIAFTSLYGVVQAARLSAARDMPVFAVGPATAKAAKAAGFLNVASASGDVAALAALVLEARLRGSVVHPCAAETAGDLVGVLNAAGIDARRIPVYRAETSTSLPSEIGKALACFDLFAALFHSPKAARAAAGLLMGGSPLTGIAALGLSSACLEPLANIGFEPLLASSAPNDDALLAALSRIAGRKP